ncbi:hypothetical protein [Thomasclavelia spiroformis]|nr:hypothetical protein [Thomasclavelia spiroformis]
MTKDEKEEVKKMMLYLFDKVENCYKNEVKNALKIFFDELKINNN